MVEIQWGYTQPAPHNVQKNGIRPAGQACRKSHKKRGTQCLEMEVLSPVLLFKSLLSPSEGECHVYTVAGQERMSKYSLCFSEDLV